MNKVIILSFYALIILNNGGRAQNLLIHQNNGGVISVSLSTIDSITFTENPVSFVCGQSTIIDPDGNVYSTVLIGNQCWTKENMNYDYGNSVCADDDPANCAIYGRLYDWATAMTVCPEGWHLPTDDEWRILEGFVDSQYEYGDSEWDILGYRGFDAGMNLKSTTGWNDNGNGPDLYGFSALPGGVVFPDGYLNYPGNTGYWWTSTLSETNNPWHRYIYKGLDGIGRLNYEASYKRSVRCLKDN